MTNHLDLIKPKTISFGCVVFCLQNKDKKQKGIIRLNQCHFVLEHQEVSHWSADHCYSSIHQTGDSDYDSVQSTGIRC